MSKSTECACFNPSCKSLIFAKTSDLLRHLATKPECKDWYVSQNKTIWNGDFASTEEAPCTMKPKDSLLFTPTPVETINDVSPDLEYFPLQPDDDSFHHIEDYENHGFHDEDADELNLPGYHTTYTNSRRVEIYLLKICNEIEAPLYAFEEIMKWAADAYHSGYDFNPRQSTYQAQMSTLEIWMGMNHQRPVEVSVTLPGLSSNPILPVQNPTSNVANDAINPPPVVPPPPDTIKVTTFDFRQQLASLLDDPVLNRDENLVINTTDRFQKYIPPDGLLGECLSGSWYNHAWDTMVANGSCDFMIPIILYVDKTQISISGKLSIFPVQMSLGIFTEKVCILCNPLLYVKTFVSHILN